MVQVPPMQKPGNLFELTKWLKNICGSYIFSKDVTHWSVYFLKTLLFYRFLLVFKVFVSFKDCVMTKGGPLLILLTFKNSNQMPN